MYSCRQFKAEIDATPRREPATTQAAAHVAACPACRSFQAERQTLARLVGALEPVGAPADFESRLRARMAARQDAAAGRFKGFRSFFGFDRLSGFGGFAFAPRLFAPGLAACLVLACAATLGWRTLQQPPSVTPSEQSAGRDVAANNAPVSVAQTQDKNALAQRDAAITQTANVARPTKQVSGRVVAATASRLGARAGRGVRVETARHEARPGLESVTGVSETSVRGSLPAVTQMVARNSMAQFAPIPLPINASAKPLRVLLRDPQGAAREVSLEPVSFGARDLFGARATAQRVNASYTQGVW
jgi:hypothetical protein